MAVESVARLHISLSDTAPEIWRRVEVPAEASLKMVHDVIQAAMGWLDYHLWEFEAAGRRYGIPDPDWEDDGLFQARNIRLRALIDRGVRQFEYTYDMGDNWHHVLTVEAVEPARPNTLYPRYIEGARRCPPEDVGGVPGFEHFLGVIADPEHEDHEELARWYGKPYDPANIEEDIVRWRIAAIAARRASGKAAYARRKIT